MVPVGNAEPRHHEGLRSCGRNTAAHTVRLFLDHGSCFHYQHDDRLIVQHVSASGSKTFVIPEPC